MPDHVLSQTNIAFFHIVFNVFFQAQPIVFPADQLSGFINSKMTYQKVIVMVND